MRLAYGTLAYKTVSKSGNPPGKRGILNFDALLTYLRDGVISLEITQKAVKPFVLSSLRFYVDRGSENFQSGSLLNLRTSHLKGVSL